MITVKGSGVLTQDAVVKPAIGTGLVELNLACVKEFSSGKKFTHYFGAKAWGKIADGLTLTKGTEVELEGELNQESWKDKTTGKNVYKTLINITKLTVKTAGEAQTQTATIVDDCPF